MKRSSLVPGSDDLLGSVLDHIEEIVLVLSSFGSLLSSTLLDDELIESKLLSSSLQDSLLDSVLEKDRRK